jgi:hypothetical protein
MLPFFSRPTVPAFAFRANMIIVVFGEAAPASSRLMQGSSSMFVQLTSPGQSQKEKVTSRRGGDNGISHAGYLKDTEPTFQSYGGIHACPVFCENIGWPLAVLCVGQYSTQGHHLRRDRGGRRSENRWPASTQERKDRVRDSQHFLSSRRGCSLIPIHIFKSYKSP